MTFEDLSKEEQALVLSLFAFNTGCLYYNTESIKIAFRDTSESTKLNYIKSVKEFIKVHNLMKSAV